MRRVKIKIIGQTNTNIDRFITSGIKKRAWESFELTQSQDVKEWHINPHKINIQPNLLDLKDIISSLNKPLYLLDVGCYSGYLYDYLRLKTSYSKNNLYYTGIDIQPSVIDAAKHIYKGNLKTSFVNGDIFKLPKYFVAKEFDVVCCYRVLIHLPYFKKSLLNLFQVANKIVHIVLHIQDRDTCNQCEETDLDTGKKTIYYRRFISENTIKKCIYGLPVTYKIIPHSSYASLFLIRN